MKRCLRVARWRGVGVASAPATALAESVAEAVAPVEAAAESSAKALAEAPAKSLAAGAPVELVAKRSGGPFPSSTGAGWVVKVPGGSKSVV